MTYRKKLIEVALPLEAINEASAREKSIRHGHPSTLHLWWARRPLAACRAVIFASLVDDPDDPKAPPEFVQACRELPRGKNAAANDTPRQRLFDFIETLVQWESTTDEQVLETARRLIRLATDGNPPPLLDPFAGGGSIPLEAQRLGLEAHASDLNPVAVMINKALIEIPPRFADMSPVNPRDRKGTAGTSGWKGAAGLAADVRYYGEWMRDDAEKQIGHLYPKVKITAELLKRRSDLREQGLQVGEELTVIAWLWVRTVKCPNPACGAQMPLARSFWLSKKRGKQAWVESIVNRTQSPPVVRFDVQVDNGKPQDGTVNRRGATCLCCNTPVPFDHIRTEGRAGRINAQLMAIVARGKSRRIYLPPTLKHELIAIHAQPQNIPDTDLPEQALGFRVQLYGMTKHSNLFTSRQLAALTTFSDLVGEAREQALRDAITAGLSDDGVPLYVGGSGAMAYADAVATYLALPVDRFADYWSALNRWQAANQQLSNTFSRQALPMLWDFAEANPFSGRGGSFDNLFDWTVQSLPLLCTKPMGKSFQADAASFSSEVAAYLVSTDPPYYDNVPYADLSDFFYVWLRRSLINVFPDLFGTLLTPKSVELVAEPYRHGNRGEARRFFEEGLVQAFDRMRQVQDSDYPLAVYYAFKQTERDKEKDTESNKVSVASTGWETILEGLIRSGFMIIGTWPIRTEMSHRMRGIESNALASSVVLVCRPQPKDIPLVTRRDFLNALRRELPAALREMQSGNIAPVDLAQASIGPGMAVYSRYSKVLEPNGDRLTVRTALQIINHELDAYLAEQEGYIDEDSRFAVAWFEQFGFQEGPFGQADVLARAKNTSVDGLAYAGILESGAGKVRLYHWSELDPGWDPATDKRLAAWEATHHLIERLNTYGEEGAARLLAKMPPNLAAEARQLAYRLYSICERKGWAEHARDYNALVISWSTSQEQAREFKEQYQQGKLF